MHTYGYVRVRVCARAEAYGLNRALLDCSDSMDYRDYMGNGCAWYAREKERCGPLLGEQRAHHEPAKRVADEVNGPVARLAAGRDLR